MSKIRLHCGGLCRRRRTLFRGTGISELWWVQAYVVGVITPLPPYLKRFDLPVEN